MGAAWGMHEEGRGIWCRSEPLLLSLGTRTGGFWKLQLQAAKWEGLAGQESPSSLAPLTWAQPQDWLEISELGSHQQLSLFCFFPLSPALISIFFSSSLFPTLCFVSLSLKKSGKLGVSSLLYQHHFSRTFPSAAALVRASLIFPGIN